METLNLSLRDFVWLVSLVVTVSLAYGRIRIELRHLDDTKAEREEVNLMGNEIRSALSDIRSTLSRLEEAIRNHS